jgi:pimeloyl-ACP methyl ester carboxylesterase
MSSKLACRYGLLFAGLLFFALAATAQAPQAVEKTVNTGSYNLVFKIIAGKSPTILLESGGGMDATEWDRLAPRLAEATGCTVVAYDRAGFGKSDLPESKYDLKEDNDALWRALGKLGLDKDLVLVGHSYGGFLLRFEASERPDAVRGLVFVDPFTVELVDNLGIDYCNNHPMMGKLSFDASQPEKLTKIERAEVRMTGYPVNNLAEKMAVMRKTAVPKGIPVRILSSSTDWFPNPGESKVWRESIQKFAASIKGAKLVVAENCDHMIPFRQPELVVNTVAEVVRLARALKGERS